MHSKKIVLPEIIIEPLKSQEILEVYQVSQQKAISIPTLTDEDGNEALTGSQKAEMLNSFFSKCFNRSSAPLEGWSGSDFHFDL